MDKVAALDHQARRDLFEATASDRGIHPAIIEKDFWVCWVLKKLFASEDLKGQLVFKGGTSLSKVFHLIHRFSEDIDLVLNWELLGYGKAGQDPWEAQPSTTKQSKSNEAFNRRADEYIRQTLKPLLKDVLSGVPGIEAVVSATEALVIDINYPAAFDLDALRPQVKLEIGPLASWVPSGEYTIKPYAAEAYPGVFEDADCPVVAIEAKRTFWEKATILHQQAHRKTAMPPGYSRHYYDLHQLAQSGIKAEAFAELILLSDVVLFKERFYPSPWARYADAKPGTFRLMPTDTGGRELRADYQKMRAMIFEEPPAWDDIITSLKQLENEINELAGDKPS